MNRIGDHIAIGLACLAALVFAGPARGQNPVQWSGNVGQSVSRAAEQSMPLLFWVTGGHRDIGEDDDLEDAQEDCFRDPVVVGIVHKKFVPVRVSRNSKVMEEAGKLGLPTTHGLYCAVLTFDGRLLDTMGPGEVTDPTAFAAHLNAAFEKFTDDLYEKELRPLLENLESPKAKARLAVQTVWRLGIRKADRAVIGLLERKDLQPTELSRLYQLLASLGTSATIGALLDRADGADGARAAAALERAEPGALEWLLPELPGEGGEVGGPISARQELAYRAAARISRLASPKAGAWWEKAGPEDRRKEAERVKAKAQSVLEYWRETQGG